MQYVWQTSVIRSLHRSPGGLDSVFCRSSTRTRHHHLIRTIGQIHFLRYESINQQKSSLCSLPRARSGLDRPDFGHQCTWSGLRRLHSRAFRQPQATQRSLRNAEPDPSHGQERALRRRQLLGWARHRREAGQPGCRPGSGSVFEPARAGTAGQRLCCLSGLHSETIRSIRRVWGAGACDITWPLISKSLCHRR